MLLWSVKPPDSQSIPPIEIQSYGLKSNFFGFTWSILTANGQFFMANIKFKLLLDQNHLRAAYTAHNSLVTYGGPHWSLIA